jgi:hypothetical protein
MLLGSNVLNSNINGFHNIAIGDSALFGGQYNIARYALRNNTSSKSCIEQMY